MSEDQWGAGDPANWHDHGTVVLGGKPYPLIYGEHPHSRQDNRHYAVIDGEPQEFDGHRVLIDVRVNSMNYMKESHYSGDQIRKGGSCEILADGEVVFEFFCRDTRGALLRAHHLIGELSEHSSGWMVKRERDALVGRKVFYRGHPAVVDRLIVDQGCVMLRTEDGKPFPPPPWRDAEWEDDGDEVAKVEVNDGNIWWFR
jgi:hypothetical protein